jgi:hypothetical protein
MGSSCHPADGASRLHQTGRAAAVPLCSAAAVRGTVAPPQEGHAVSRGAAVARRAVGVLAAIPVMLAGRT